MFNMDVMKNTTRVLILDVLYAPNDDIRRYLEGEMSRIFTERNILACSPSEADIIHRLVLEASGQFTYASTVIKFLDDSRDHNTRMQFDIILNSRRSTSSYYAPLDQLYIKILSEQQNINLLKGIFVLIFAFGYVDFHLICQCLWTNEEDLKLKLRRIHSLLNISDSGIKPHHLSFLDFLMDKNRAGKYSLHPLLVKLARLPFSVMRLSGNSYYASHLMMIAFFMASATIASVLCSGLAQSNSGSATGSMIIVLLVLEMAGVIYILSDTKARNRVLRRLLAELAVLELESPEETTAISSAGNVVCMRSEAGEMMDPGHGEETEGETTSKCRRAGRCELSHPSQRLHLPVIGAGEPVIN